MSDFLAMGGYAGFVWPTWGISVLAIGGLVIHALLERRAAREALRRIEEDEA
ncbi:heme exporter protein CcmD [Maricaulis sp.]|uniref:heme exporter protein CcmD n=1 Tax=Maricaulis sp. TaxID=1486257 RepID=UPI0025BB0A4D|nr:heme exporter protein CcmD [Maricaulis sp.]